MIVKAWLIDLFFPPRAWAGRIDYSKVSDDALMLNMLITGLIITILAVLGLWGLWKYKREHRRGKNGWPVWAVVGSVSIVILFWLIFFWLNMP